MEVLSCLASLKKQISYLYSPIFLEMHRSARSEYAMEASRFPSTSTLPRAAILFSSSWISSFFFLILARAYSSSFSACSRRRRCLGLRLKNCLTEVNTEDSPVLILSNIVSDKSSTTSASAAVCEEEEEGEDEEGEALSFFSSSSSTSSGCCSCSCCCEDSTTSSAPSIHFVYSEMTGPSCCAGVSEAGAPSLLTAGAAMLSALSGEADSGCASVVSAVVAGAASGCSAAPVAPSDDEEEEEEEAEASGEAGVSTAPESGAVAEASGRPAGDAAPSPVEAPASSDDLAAAAGVAPPASAFATLRLAV
mmetsp:Transcript_50964/g.110366  ORF Transcript_50964/g.110366 Transcript_50964/m.110366 type:complete len:307 (-) Transcript_50964:250-1170(-)